MVPGAPYGRDRGAGELGAAGAWWQRGGWGRTGRNAGSQPLFTSPLAVRYVLNLEVRRIGRWKAGAGLQGELDGLKK